jgi:formylglycine-generating enzyme required for sulfatase activity
MDFQQRYNFNPKTDLIGRGGFSKVYKATDTLLERIVALKFFTGNISEKYQVLNEIRKVIRFEHPNLCKYYDVAVLTNRDVMGETEHIEVGIMEYIDAGDFKSFTRKNPQYVDKLLIDVLKGLAYLHRHGIAHRDLKPQNILVKTDEDEPIAKITDFGISKVIATDDANSSHLLGTIEYMAPEQFNPKKYGVNGRITTNLDMWSFGLLVYEAINHESFFGSRSGGVSAEQVMANILSEASLEKAATMPAKYREILKRCLVKKAGERVQNALELIPLLEGKIIVDPVTETDQKYDIPDSSSEVTQVINVVPEMITGEIGTAAQNTITREISTVGQYGRSGETSTVGQNTITEEISSAEQIPEMTAEVTREIEPDRRAEEAEPDARANTTKTVLTGGATNKVPDTNGKDVFISERIKKIIILSSLAISLIVLVIAVPFVTQLNTSPEQAVTTTDSQPSLPAVEEWKPELVQVKGGSFIMGDSGTNSVASDHYGHDVSLSDFFLGKYEVTVAQFKYFINETKYTTTAQQKGSSQIFVNGRWIPGNGVDWRHDAQGRLINSNIEKIPVVHVSWTDANAYCQWLSKKMNETYRLLTEAEWEFAARGGDKSKRYIFSGGDSINQVAWYQKNSDSSIHPIGTKNPNELGVYDMSGNVLEWCNDWYDKDYYKNQLNENPKGPDAPAKDSQKVLRGGAWAYQEKFVRNVHRAKLKPDVVGGGTGFRVCRVNR